MFLLEEDNRDLEQSLEKQNFLDMIQEELTINEKSDKFGFITFMNF